MSIRYTIFLYASVYASFMQGLSAPQVPTVHEASSYAREDWSSPLDSIGRFHIVFKNESIEEVMVSIYRLNIEPLPKNTVRIGEWCNFFPQQMTTHERPLYINLRGSSAGDLHYVLELNGKPRVGATHACRAYGSLDLKQGDEIVQSIGASVLDTGLILTYTPYYDLEMSSLKDHIRGRRSNKDPHAGRCRKGSCSRARQQKNK